MYEILILFISLLAFASVGVDKENWLRDTVSRSTLLVVHLPPIMRKVWTL